MSPEIRSILKLDLSQTPEESLAKLPVSLRNVISPIVDVAGDAQSRDESERVATTVHQRLGDQRAGMEGRVKKISTGEGAPAPDSPEFEAYRRDQAARINAEATEARGATQVAGFFLDALFPDNPRVSKVVTTVANAAINVTSSAGLLSLGFMGPLGFAGGVVSAFGSVMGLFGGGQPTFEEQVFKHFDLVHKQLEDIRTTLNRIEERQYEILKNMFEISRQLAARDLRQQYLLRRLSDDIQRLSRTVELQARESALTTFDTSLRNAKDLVVGPRGEEWMGEFRRIKNFFLTHALGTAATSAFIGQPTGNSLRQLLKEIEGRDQLDLAIENLDVVAGVLGLNAPNAATSYNPIEWARGTQAYLELRGLDASVRFPDDEDNLRALWNVGSRLAHLVRLLGSPRALQHAALLYRACADGHALSWGYQRVDNGITSLPWFYENRPGGMIPEEFKNFWESDHEPLDRFEAVTMAARVVYILAQARRVSVPTSAQLLATRDASSGLFLKSGSGEPSLWLSNFRIKPASRHDFLREWKNHGDPLWAKSVANVVEQLEAEARVIPPDPYASLPIIDGTLAQLAVAMRTAGIRLPEPVNPPSQVPYDVYRPVRVALATVLKWSLVGFVGDPTFPDPTNEDEIADVVDAEDLVQRFTNVSRVNGNSPPGSRASWATSHLVRTRYTIDVKFVVDDLVKVFRQTLKEMFGDTVAATWVESRNDSFSRRVSFREPTRSDGTAQREINLRWSTALSWSRLTLEVLAPLAP
jgi:hypothetical protein